MWRDVSPNQNSMALAYKQAPDNYLWLHSLWAGGVEMSKEDMAFITFMMTMVMIMTCAIGLMIVVARG